MCCLKRMLLAPEFIVAVKNNSPSRETILLNLGKSSFLCKPVRSVGFPSESERKEIYEGPELWSQSTSFKLHLSFYFSHNLLALLGAGMVRWFFFSFLEECRQVEMDHLIHDFFLENHVIRRREIISASACEVSCYMAADCVSYNLRQPQDPDGGYLCELNNSTNEIHPFDVKYEKGAVYQSFQVRW